MKTLTIAIPMYNTEKYIERCLDSITIDEVLPDIEIIVVNDGSTDNSLQIANKYASKYPDSVIVEDKENGGHGSTVNKALELATGKYFRVLDSDDWFDSLDFISFVKKLKNENSDLVITNYTKEHIYNGFSEILEYTNLEDNKKYDFDTFDLLLLDKEYFVMATSTYKTEILKKSKLKLLEKTFYVDMQYNVVPILQLKSFKFFDLNVYRYFIGRPNQSMNIDNFIRNRKQHERVLKFLIEYYTSNFNLFSRNKKEYISMIIVYMITTHYYIYCVYNKSDKKILYKEIRDFDNYLKATNINLYRDSYKIGQIMCNRKTKFIFTLINPQFFSKSISFAKRFKKRKREALV